VSTPLLYLRLAGPPLPERKRQRPYVDPETGRAVQGKRTDEPRQAAWKKGAVPFAQIAMRKAGHGVPFTCPLRVMITCRRKSPEKPVKWVPDLRFDTDTPDLTNLVKLIEDAFNGIIWEDDRLIVEQVNRKEFGAKEEVLITVWEAQL
jgi:Holliday junction resolvase RusA-like endonuclease